MLIALLFYYKAHEPIFTTLFATPELQIVMTTMQLKRTGPTTSDTWMNCGTTLSP